MSKSVRHGSFALHFGVIAALLLSVLAAKGDPPVRSIVVDLTNTSGPVDRFFDFSVGSDFPGTLIRADSLGQLKTAADELGFRYIRFHAIFHDALGTVKIENDKAVPPNAKA